MPYAETAETAHRWATERAIDCWAWYANDLTVEDLRLLATAADSIRNDGGTWAVVVPRGIEPSTAAQALADVTVSGEAAPAPWGLFAAMQAAGVSDVARLGVIGRSRDVLEAGRRAGAGVVVALAEDHPDARLPLLPAQPDVIIEPGQLTDFYAQRWSSDRAHRQRVLLNPGPAVVSDRVHRAVGGPDLCHREPEYSDILERVRRKLLGVAGVPDDWAMIMLAGSGTAALEGMTGAAVRPGKKLLVCKNGIYGERVETIARRLGVPVVLVESIDTEPIDPAQVAAALEANPDVDAVAVIHHETTTGLLNPVQAIAAEAKSRGVLVLVDAISSLGAEELDIADIRHRLRRVDVEQVLARASGSCVHSRLTARPGADRRGAAAIPLLRPGELSPRPGQAHRALHAEHSGALRIGGRSR